MIEMGSIRDTPLQWELLITGLGREDVSFFKEVSSFQEVFKYRLQ